MHVLWNVIVIHVETTFRNPYLPGKRVKLSKRRVGDQVPPHASVTGP